MCIRDRTHTHTQTNRRYAGMVFDYRPLSLYRQQRSLKSYRQRAPSRPHGLFFSSEHFVMSSFLAERTAASNRGEAISLGVLQMLWIGQIWQNRLAAVNLLSLSLCSPSVQRSCGRLIGRRQNTRVASLQFELCLLYTSPSPRDS